MWRRILFILGLAVCLNFFISPVSIFAQTTSSEPACQCFCGAKSGAQLVSAAKTQSACEQACKKNKQSIVVCATTTAQNPERNRRCFDKANCDLMKGELGTIQPEECINGNYYCFPKAEKSEVALSTSIGDLKTVSDLGKYIEAVYKYLLGAAVLFSVIMVMIGGLQYTLGAGVQEQIAKGKERIKNGVIGLVLLFCAILILQIVNPQLLRLELPRLSLVRSVEIGGKSCEDYLKAGFAVDSKAKKEIDAQALQKDGKLVSQKVPACGAVGELGPGPDGTVAAEGAVCDFRGCVDFYERCLGVDKNAQCVRCEAIVPDNKFGIKPSSAVCSKLQIGDSIVADDNGQMQGQIRRCFYTQDPDALFLSPTATTAAIVGVGSVPLPGSSVVAAAIGATQLAYVLSGTCAAIEHDCSNINTCSDYDRIDVKNLVRGTVSNPMDDDLDEIDIWSDVTLETICDRDPCGKGGKLGCKTFGTNCKPATYSPLPPKSDGKYDHSKL